MCCWAIWPVVVLPSPLVSPPTESSASEVKTTGWVAVPTTTRRPPEGTTSPVEPFESSGLFTTVPAANVSVPLGRNQCGSNTAPEAPSICHVLPAATVPEQ